MRSVFVALALAFGTPNTQTVVPRVTVVDESPFTVRGTGLKPGERVVLTLVGENRLTRRVTASPAGTFLRAVLLFKLDLTCPVWFVKAVGNRGTVVVARAFPSCANIGPIDR
jgi:hypothetical protein